MVDAQAWIGRVSHLKRLAEQEYRETKNRYLLPKSKEYTDLDRETQINARCAEIYFDFGVLEDYERALYNRVSSAQSSLNSIDRQLRSLSG